MKKVKQILNINPNIPYDIYKIYLSDSIQSCKKIDFSSIKGYSMPRGSFSNIRTYFLNLLL